MAGPPAARPVAPPAGSGRRLNHGRFFGAWVAGLAVVLGLLFSVPTLLTLTLWATDPTYSLSNPVLDLAFFVLGAMIVAGVLVRYRTRHMVGVQQAMLALLALAAAGWLGGRIEPLVGALVLMVAIAPLALVDHGTSAPDASGRGPDQYLAALTLIAAGPSAVYAFVMLGRARTAGPSCFLGQCVQGDRYAEAAALSITLIAVALLASIGSQCWPLPTWSAGATAAMLGVVSLILPQETGALPGGWAALAIAWAVTFVMVAYLRHGPEARLRRRHRRSR